MKLEQVINQIASNPKQMFLVDCIGAIVSMLLLGVVLVQLESIIGMPSHILQILALIAGVFAVYSFLCYRLAGEKWSFLLKIIGIANLIYCLTTLGLVFYLFEQLTNLGVAYFILECMIIFSLVFVELKTANGYVKR